LAVVGEGGRLGSSFILVNKVWARKYIKVSAAPPLAEPPNLIWPQANAIVTMRFKGRLLQGILLDRPNRFIGLVKVGRKRYECFVPDPGRAEDMLYPGATVYIKEGKVSEDRRTAMDLVLAQDGKTLVSVDTRLTNQLVLEAMEAKAIKELKGYKVIGTEHEFLGSRFDFLLKGRKGEMLLEAKSVTLMKDGTALFPDAPTERGSRHLKTMADSLRRGMKAAVIFVIQRGDAKAFGPNDIIDPEFGLSLRVAMAKGVEAYAYKCKVSKTGIQLAEKVPVKL
jgi:sugar fermentation stimulation protein A